MHMSEVLIVEDELSMRTALEANFRRRGWKVHSASGVSDAVEKFRATKCKLVVTDMRMADGDGMAVMQGVRGFVPDIPVIILTAYGSVPGAVQAIKEGACDYLQKPVSFDELESTAQRFLRNESDGSEEGIFEGIAESEALRRLLSRAQHVARTDADVLIEAESGTGKELVARMIHRASSRSKNAFVAVNCSALPDSLLESELFGHMRGAFTGAAGTKLGKFELAHGGTLLLDEVGEMPMALQPKLLRVLQEREIDRLGDTRSIPVDVRVIATTNRSLRERVDAGQFRSDLYYRLNVVPLTIPPLRERREDIVPMAHYFLRKHGACERFGTKTISPELLDQMKAHDWPGNARELENFVRRALALSTGTTLMPQLIEPTSEGVQPDEIFGVKSGNTLETVERQLLEKTLRATRGNRTRTAMLMGVSVRTVRKRIRDYGLPERDMYELD
jgi:DNA-binding NtrC family response regulator